MQLAARFRMLQSVPSSDAHKPRNSRISLSVGFFSAPLTTLNISYNSLGVEGAKAIAGALPRYDSARRALSNDAFLAL